MSTKNEQKDPPEFPNLHQRMLNITRDCQKKKSDKKALAGKFSYDYTSHNAVTDLIQPLLVLHGVDAMPCLRKVEREKITEFDYNHKEVIKNRTTVYFDILFFNVDDPEDQEAVPWFSEAIGNNDKVLGIAVSAGIRQCYQKRFKLRTDDPDLEENEIPTGNEKTKKTEPPKENNAPKGNKDEMKLATPKQIGFIKGQAKRFKWDDIDLHHLYSEYKVNGPEELAFASVNEILDKLKAGPPADIPF